MRNPYHTPNVKVIDDLRPIGMRVGMIVFSVVVAISLAAFLFFTVANFFRSLVVWWENGSIKLAAIMIFYFSQVSCAAIAGGYIGRSIERRGYSRSLIVQAEIALLVALELVVMVASIFNPGHFLNPVEAIEVVLNEASVSSPKEAALGLIGIWGSIFFVLAINSVITWVIIRRLRRQNMAAF